MRDPTRGGVATTLNEIARQSGVCIEIQETSIPVRPAVAAACELLGFDPLYVANEGKILIIAAPEAATLILETMHSQPYGQDSRIIGHVLAEPQNRVLMRTALGSTRLIDMLAGEMLPRIC
jgi:hydrogenase expression/formation protein HypE